VFIVMGRQEDLMDGSRFDAWTRRSLGLAAGGLAAAMVSLTTPNAAGKKKKKEKTCRKILETCSTTGSGPSCCGTLNCDIVGTTGLHCCLGLRSSCDAANNRCCGHLKCAEPTDEDETICCASAGDPCEVDRDCCADAGDAFCNVGGECELFDP
jgi:hypothetical protein